MRPIKTQKGYTIVETLIVVVVTGMLLISASLMIRGQIAKQQHREGMNQVVQYTQNAIRDTENGYFPTNTNSAARLGGGGPGTDSGWTLQGKRLAYCSSVAGDPICLDGNTKLRIETLKGTPSHEFVVMDTQYINLPAGLRYIGSYINGGPPPPADAQQTATGFNVLYSNLLGSGGGTGSGTNVFGAEIGFTPQSVKMYNYYVDGMTAGTDPVGNTKDMGMVGNDFSNINLGYGRTACFEGHNRGSITFGKQGSLTLEVNYDDPKCKSTANGGLMPS